MSMTVVKVHERRADGWRDWLEGVWVVAIFGVRRRRNWPSTVLKVLERLGRSNFNSFSSQSNWCV